MQIHHAADLQKLPGIAHGFFGRDGGLSTGIYASLNCGPGSRDDATAVAGNRARVIQALAPGARLVSLAQVHSAIVHIVDDAWNFDLRQDGDGMATARSGVMLGILTADCTPVLFADAEAGVIGAAHAGWKGALTGIVEATVEAMEKLGADRTHIVVAIGPLIRQQSYEVGSEFVERFVQADAENSRYFLPAARDGHAMFDLAAFIRKRLESAGVLFVDDTGIDTYSDERFFSYRRSVHRKEADYGRHVHAIVLES